MEVNHTQRKAEWNACKFIFNQNIEQRVEWFTSLTATEMSMLLNVLSQYGEYEVTIITTRAVYAKIATLKDNDGNYLLEMSTEANGDDLFLGHKLLLTALEEEFCLTITKTKRNV